MGQPYQFIGNGFYTSTAVAMNIPLSDRPDKFVVIDTTLWGANNATDYTAAANIQSQWNRSMASGSYLQTGQAASAIGAASTYLTQGSTNGFTFVDQTNPPTYTKVALTAVNGQTFVVTATNTSLNVGDWVRLINVVGAQELSSIAFQVTSLTATTAFTLGMAATAATALGSPYYGNGTTGFFQKIYPGFMYPKLKTVLFISQATQAKVYFGTPNDFTVGELVDFQIPTPYGMTQMSNLTANSRNGSSGNPAGAARVLVVTNTSTESSITLDYNTSGFTAFVYPTSATVAAGASPPTCFPAGSGIVPFNGSATIPQSPPGTNLQDAFDNRAQYVMNLGTAVVGASSSVMYWEAWRGDYFNGVTNA